MCTAFRDGFQSVYGARVLTNDFLPALAAARDAGVAHETHETVHGSATGDPQDEPGTLHVHFVRAAGIVLLDEATATAAVEAAGGEERGVDLRRQRPLDPREPARRRVARDTAVHDPDIVPALFEPRTQLRYEAVLLDQPVSLRQAVTQRQQVHRLGPGGRREHAAEQHQRRHPLLCQLIPLQGSNFLHDCCRFRQ